MYNEFDWMSSLFIVSQYDFEMSPEFADWLYGGGQDDLTPDYLFWALSL